MGSWVAPRRRRQRRRRQTGLMGSHWWHGRVHCAGASIDASCTIKVTCARTPPQEFQQPLEFGETNLSRTVPARVSGPVPSPFSLFPAFFRPMPSRL